jgi:hypothetical protein
MQKAYRVPFSWRHCVRGNPDSGSVAAALTAKAYLTRQDCNSASYSRSQDARDSVTPSSPAAGFLGDHLDHGISEHGRSRRQQDLAIVKAQVVEFDCCLLLGDETKPTIGEYESSTAHRTVRARGERILGEAEGAIWSRSAELRERQKHQQLFFLSFPSGRTAFQLLDRRSGRSSSMPTMVCANGHCSLASQEPTEASGVTSMSCRE